ncbi:MAG: hypothetical protein WC641_05455 [Patescibacteria group bacterium]
MRTSSIFSRIVLVLGGLAVLGFTYWLLATSLAPIEVPPLAVSRREIKFDPRVDMSKNEKFLRLKPLGDGVPELTGLGRSNPFMPLTMASSTPVQAPK